MLPVTRAQNPAACQRPPLLVGTHSVHFLSLTSRTLMGINPGGQAQLIKKYLFLCFAAVQLNYFSKTPFFMIWQEN